MNRAFTVLALLALTACGSSDEGAGVPQGALVVTVTTSGADQDVDGYRIAIIHLGDSTAVAANDTIQFDVPPGAYSAQPGGDIMPGASAVAIHGVAENCVGAGSGGHVVVADGGVDTLAFTVTCTATTGSLAIRMVTNGVALDPDGYSITIDGGAPFTTPVNAPSTAKVLAVGDHSVAIAGVVMNCTPTAAGPVTINIEPAEADTLWWEVDCAWPRVLVRRNSNDLAYINPDGTNEQIRFTGIVGDQFRHPAFAPDRDQIAVDMANVSGPVPGRLVAIAAADSTTFIPIADTVSGYRPRWRADGNALLELRADSVVGGYRLTEVTFPGQVRTPLSPDSLRVTGADWSPDGTQIAFSANLAGQDTRLYVIAAAGGAPARISPDSVVAVGAPRWSPTGSQIAFVSVISGRLLVIAPNGTGLAEVPVVGGNVFEDFTWSPDGSSFLVRFFDSISGGGGLASLPITGGAPTVLPTPNAGISYHEPDWR